MKYPFTKTRFRLKFPGLAGKICIENFKQNKLPFSATAVSSQQNEKHPNEDQQCLPHNTRLWLREVC